MKIKACILFILFFGCSSNEYAYQPSRGSVLVHEVLAETAKTVKKEYGLHPCGSGVSMPGGPIRFISICFDSRNAYSRNELRVLLIKIADLMIQEVSKNEEIQKHLLTPPFTAKNVEVIIYNHDAKGYELFDPQICVAEIYPEGLIYRTSDPDNPLRYKNKHRETYEEALELLKNKQ